MKPACMDRSEYEHWRQGVSRIPCRDCTREYAAEMRVDGRCRLYIGGGYIAGVPGGTPLSDPDVLREYYRLKQQEYRDAAKAAA